MIIDIKIAVFIICSGLFWLGGFSFLPARRFIMPTILTLTALFLTHALWSLTMLSVIGIFCLGYGEKSPLRHIFGNGWGRGVWGVLAGLCLSIGLFLSGHLSLFFLLPFLALNFTLENALKNINQKIGDPLIGAGFSCIVFLIH